MNLLPINCYNKYTIYRKVKSLSLKDNHYKDVSKLYRKFKSRKNVYLMRTLNSGNLDNKGVNIGEVVRVKEITDNIRFTGDNNEVYFLSEFSIVMYYIIYNQTEIEVCDLDLPYIYHDKDEQTILGNITGKLLSIYDMDIKIRHKTNTNNVQLTTWSSQLNRNSVYIYDTDGSARMINTDEWEVTDREQLLFLSDIQKVKYLTEIYDSGIINDTAYIKEVKKIVSM